MDASEKPAAPEERRTLLQRIFVRRGISQAVLLPILSVLTALLVGGVIIAVSTPDVLQAWGNFFQAPLQAFGITFLTVWKAYVALFEGSFGRPAEIITGFGTWIGTGNSGDLIRALRPLGESLVLTTPYIFAGLAV